MLNLAAWRAALLAREWLPHPSLHRLPRLEHSLAIEHQLLLLLVTTLELVVAWLLTLLRKF